MTHFWLTGALKLRSYPISIAGIQFAIHKSVIRFIPRARRRTQKKNYVTPHYPFTRLRQGVYKNQVKYKHETKSIFAIVQNLTARTGLFFIFDLEKECRWFSFSRLLPDRAVCFGKRDNERW